MRPLVLVVEDDKLIYEVISLTLKQVGFEVLGAPSAEQILHDITHQRHSNVVGLITDVHLNGAMDGFALAHAVRRHDPSLAVLVISARPYPDAHDRLPPGTCFLWKPFSPQSLIDVFKTSITM